MYPEKAVKSGTFGQALTVVFVILLLLTVALVLASFPAGVFTVYFGHLSTKIDWTSLSQPYFYLGPVLQALPFKSSVGVSFFALTCIYAGMLALSLRQGRSPASAISDSIREGVGQLFSSTFFVVMIATGFLIFTATVVNNIVIAAGATIGDVVGDPLALLLGFTTAPLVEELGFRVLLIGLLAAIFAFGRNWKEVLRALWRPSVVYESGPKRLATKLVLFAMLVASALIFGLAHVVSGWEFGKLFEATYGGIVLGFLYVKYGFHVAVLAHWGVDYFGTVFAFFGQAAYGVPWDSSTTEFAVQLLVDYDMVLLFGFASFIVVVYLGIRRLASRSAVTSPTGIGSS